MTDRAAPVGGTTATFRDVAFVAIAAAAMLVATGAFLDLSRLHVYGILNDQAGYVTVGRDLAETGALSGNAKKLKVHNASRPFK